MALISGRLNKKIFSNIKNVLVNYARRASSINDDFPEFIISRPDPADYEDVMMMLWEVYHIDEPTIKYLGIGKIPHTYFRERTMKSLSQGLSLIAKSTIDNSIVGGAINETTYPGDPDLMHNFSVSVNNTKVKQLCQFYAHVQRFPDLWNRTDAQKIFEICHLFVSPEHRAKGVATNLVQQAIEVGKTSAHRCIRMNASSDQAAHIASKLGMRLICEIPYCSILGSNKKPVFNAPTTDSSVKVFVTLPPLRKK